MAQLLSCLDTNSSNHHYAAAMDGGGESGGGRGEGRKLPEVVLLRHPQHFYLTDTPLPTDFFRFLKPFESPHLSLLDFLTLHCASAEALLTSGGFPVPFETISRLPSLRLVLTTSAGLNHIDLAECRWRGIAVASAGDVYSADVADFAVGLFIDVLRRVSAADRWVRRGKWREGSSWEYPLGFKLGGKRVGIVGLGRIGLQVAKRLEPFGCNVLYTSRKEKPSVPYTFYPNALELSSNCDALIICSELNNETHHMINKQVMLALGKDGVIVNIGRGTIIDEEEMVKLLIQGELGGAGLDVFENEPHVPGEFLAMDNVVLSPHKAVLTPESMLDICKLMVGNLEAFFSNRPLLSPVHLDE